ncbi:MAG: hypothetical protein LBK28_04635 [Propionibacteriaceae bacterium]|nr:hypothetical protein [Propionibacteriaceae bacterium]
MTERLALTTGPDHISGTIGVPVKIATDNLTIPCRIYRGWESPASSPFSGTQQQIAACLMTRHHNGFVRQRWASLLSQPLRPWTAPYLIALLGEYVIQLTNDIAATWEGYKPDSQEARILATCYENNPAFIQLTQNRATSYWNEYYRSSGALADYPAIKALNLVKTWEATA